MKKIMFLGFLPKDTVVDCFIKEHRLWLCPSMSSVLGKKKIEGEEEAVWLVILEKKEWQIIFGNRCKIFITERWENTVGPNTIESSDSWKYVWPEFYKSLEISLGCRCSCHLNVFALKYLFPSYQDSNDFQFTGESLPVEDPHFQLLAFPQDLILSKNKYCKVTWHQEQFGCHRGKWTYCKGSLLTAEIIWRRMLILCYTFTWSDSKRAGEGSQVTSFRCAGDSLWQ